MDNSVMPELLEMVPSHFDRVEKIERAAFSTPWTRRDFEFARSRKNGFCRVAMVEGEIVGYVVGFLIDREVHLANFAIATDFQQRGLGRRTMEAVFDLLETKAQVVSLEVRMSNWAAIDLYKKMGFETMAIRKAYYTHPREDALVMLKPLNTRLSDWVSQVLKCDPQMDADGRR